MYSENFCSFVFRISLEIEICMLNFLFPGTNLFPESVLKLNQYTKKKQFFDYGNNFSICESSWFVLLLLGLPPTTSDRPGLATVLWPSPPGRGQVEASPSHGEADLAVMNGTLLNVYTGELLQNWAVLTKGSWIAYVGDEPEKNIGPDTAVLDAGGKIL